MKKGGQVVKFPLNQEDLIFLKLNRVKSVLTLTPA
jgi:hypothetical protein